MKKLCYLSLLLLLVSNCSQKQTRNTAEEETLPPFMTEYEDEGTITGVEEEICRAQVVANYNIRTGPSVQHPNCGAGVVRASSSRAGMVEVLKLRGDWAIIRSKATENCPYKIAYTHVKALRKSDYDRIRNNDCGTETNLPNPPPAPQRQTPSETTTQDKPLPPRVKGSVAAINGYSYRFPLDRCFGLKNKGGLGHFGAPRRSGGKRYRHTGCDYYAPKGTPVRSPCNGKVETSGYSRRAGRKVYIRCNDGTLVRFMHLHSSPRKASRGARVSVGTTVGGVGNSGNASRQAPHLHTEVFYKGRGRVDPQRVWACGGDSGK